MPAKIDDRPRKQRTCLKCNKSFPSFGPGHRICDRCVPGNNRIGKPVDARSQGGYVHHPKALGDSS